MTRGQLAAQIYGEVHGREPEHGWVDGIGKSQDTPVAIIQSGTTAAEKMVIGTVKDIFFKAQYAGISNPAVVVVGEVVKLHLLIKR